MTIDEILANEEYQIFDRQSIQIAATSLSDTICAFANADGGQIAIGVSDKTRRIKGTDIQIKMFDDRLEVDSPGTFAGMVKKDNIRYTHFSRNSKIAAFLKDYGYVEEYGEGVDRMCRELEAIGLPDPTFNNSTFILKTTVMSSAYEKLPIQREGIADSVNKLPIDNAILADSVQSASELERIPGRGNPSARRQ